MDLMEGIYTRRSVRQFTEKRVTRDELVEIIKAGTWAPSGLNNQPWRFVIIHDRDTLNSLAKLTKYRKIIEDAPSCIAVFVDKQAIYNEVKDHQAMGACIQNMLLSAHAMGLGAVWLGEILNNAEKVTALLELSEDLDLMAVIAIGHPTSKARRSQRKDTFEVIIKEI